MLAVVALYALRSRPLHLSIRCQTEWVCGRPLSQHRHLDWVALLTLLYSGKGKRLAWRYEERKAAVPMAVLKWAITRRPLPFPSFPLPPYSLPTPHRRFLMKSLMNANTVYRHDCDADWGQIKKGRGGGEKSACNKSTTWPHCCYTFPVFLPSPSCPVYRLLIKACRPVHLIRIHKENLG